MPRVTAPDGRQWRVGRRWLPWQPRFRRIEFDSIDYLPLDDGLLVGLLVMLAVFVLSLLLGALVILVVLGIEWLLVALIVPLAALWRLVWRRPWTVYAISEDRAVRRRTVGWAASKAMAAQMAENIEATGRVGISTRRPGRRPYGPW